MSCGFATTTACTSLVERFRQEHPDGTDFSAVPNILVRCISPSELNQAPPDYLVAEAAAGDTVILRSGAASRGAGMAAGDVAFEAAAHEHGGSDLCEMARA